MTGNDAKQKPFIEIIEDVVETSGVASTSTARNVDESSSKDVSIYSKRVSSERRHKTLYENVKISAESKLKTITIEEIKRDDAETNTVERNGSGYATNVNLDADSNDGEDKSVNDEDDKIERNCGTIDREENRKYCTFDYKS